MSNVDKKARKSFCLQSRMYRIKQNRSGKINFICDSNIDKHNEKFRINNKDIFEFYPYKPYWFFRLKWRIKPLIKKLIEYINVKTANNKHLFSILKWVFAIIGAIASVLYIIEFKIK